MPYRCHEAPESGSSKRSPAFVEPATPVQRWEYCILAWSETFDKDVEEPGAWKRWWIVSGPGDQGTRYLSSDLPLEGLLAEFGDFGWELVTVAIGGSTIGGIQGFATASRPVSIYYTFERPKGVR